MKTRIAVLVLCSVFASSAGAWTVGSTSCWDTNEGSYGLSYVISQINEGLGSAGINFDIPGAGPHVINCGGTVSNRFITLDEGSEDIVIRGTLDFKGGATIWGCTFENTTLYCREENGMIGGVTFNNSSLVVGSNYSIQGVCSFSNTSVYLGDRNTIQPTVTWAGDNNPISMGWWNDIHSGAGLRMTINGPSNEIYNCDIRRLNAYGSDNTFTGNTFNFNISPYNCNFYGTNCQVLGNQFFSSQLGSVGVYGDSNAFQGNVVFSNYDGLILQGHYNEVRGNLFGTDPTGLSAASNRYHSIESHGDYNVIGGTNASDRNVFACGGGDAIQVVEGAACVVQGNHVGVNAAGGIIGRVGGYGILLWSGSNHVVGGSGDARNVIVGCGYHGIDAGASGVRFENNLVGLLPSGQVIGNGWAGNYHGLLVSGDDAVVKDNTICASSNGWGVYISGSHNTVVAGNRIGTDSTGTNAYGNGHGGIYIVNSTNVTIGGSSAADRNIIVASGGTTSNNGAGVCFEWSDFHGSRVVGNYIGLGPDGVTPLGNTNYGVLLRSSRFVTIGTTNAGERNVISGNGIAGISLRNSDHNTIEANLIGTAASGLAPLPNGVGIYCEGAVSNWIGGYPISRGNVIAGNWGDGLRLYPGSAHNIVRGNFVGVDTDGTDALPNGGHGISMLGEVSDDTDFNWIGGTNSGSTFWRDGNVISGNYSNGVNIAFRAPYNSIAGNLIGLDTSGRYPVPNWEHGIHVLYNYNYIGGDEANIICGNKGDGIRLDAGSGWCEVYSNYIGLLNYGASNVPNEGHGVSMVNGARYHYIGETRTNRANNIGGNGGDGVYIGPGAYGNYVQGNYIGYPQPFQQSLPNAGAGIHLVGTRDNWIGGVTSNEGNIVDGQTGLFYEFTTNNWAYDNFVGFDPAGFVISTTLQYGIRVSGAQADTFGQFNASNVIGAAKVAGIYVEQSRIVRFDNAIVGCGLQGGFTMVTNAGDGVVMTNSAGCVISGSKIGGNRIGIVMLNTITNFIRGCLVGTTNTDLFFGPVGNGQAGILVDGGVCDRIGGRYASFVNTISGNMGPGVVISNSIGVEVQGNYIGLDLSGWSAVTNWGHGVLISGGSNVVVGGAYSNRNFIAGNAGDGIHVVDVGLPAVHFIAGNRVGVNMSSVLPVPNLDNGIVLRDVAGVVVGGTTQTDANIVSGNLGHGLLVTGALSQAHVIMYNVVGASADGLSAIPNGVSGVMVAGARGNTLALNLLSGNTENGVLISGPTASNNLLVGNSVGVDVTGTNALGNGQDGVRIVDAPDNTLTNNFLSGNGGSGVCIVDTDFTSVARNNRIAANVIGVTAQGQMIPNFGSGVCISNATWNYVGRGNMIGGNLRHGVEIREIGAHDNFILANLIGCGPDVTNPIPNAIHGIQLFGGDANKVGRTNAWDANVIMFNMSNGVNVARGVANAIHANSIFGNAFMGINLGTAGVSNIEQDGVPNRYQNFPYLTNVFRGSTHVFGDLVTKSNAEYLVEFFWSESVNLAGYGEGQAMLDRQTLVTDGDGLAHFEIVYPFTLPTGTILTATATDTNGNTSEFTYPPALIQAAPDGDGDGMPDFWEELYEAWGLDPDIWNDPTF
ncbi:MAG: right-handed parallel beta-helix repeat-containing protein, partial [Kiritimatiellae bacterium]|nr:right-handed parallel beta-helix repeat-containing protein [Kiritimatiellia bacterium]